MSQPVSPKWVAGLAVVAVGMWMPWRAAPGADPWVPALVLAGICAAVAGGGWLVLRRTPPPPE